MTVEEALDIYAEFIQWCRDGGIDRPTDDRLTAASRTLGGPSELKFPYSSTHAQAADLALSELERRDAIKRLAERLDATLPSKPVAKKRPFKP